MIVDKGFLVEYKLFLIDILDFGKFFIVIVIVNVLLDVCVVENFIVYVFYKFYY